MKEIEIDGIKYKIDVDKCIKDGYLKKDLPFNVGGIYKDPTGSTNSFILVQAIYCDNYTTRETSAIYALLGLNGGHAPNSNPFFKELHTKDEILAYLSGRGMVFDKKAPNVFA
jgi:hypothetical protein